MGQAELNMDKDTFLLQQLEKGSKRAFNILFEKYWEKAFSDAYKRIKNYDDAKDIVQEIFTHIWINREKKHIENLPAYLHVAIRNKVIKLISKQKPIHPFFDILNSMHVPIHRNPKRAYTCTQQHPLRDYPDLE